MTRPAVSRRTWEGFPTWGKHREAVRLGKHSAFIEAAGCAIGTVYTYFSSKDALLEQVDARALDVLCDWLEELPSEALEGPEHEPQVAARVLVSTAAMATGLGAGNPHESDGESSIPPSGTALARALLLSWGAQRRTLAGPEELMSQARIHEPRQEEVESWGSDGRRALRGNERRRADPVRGGEGGDRRALDSE